MNNYARTIWSWIVAIITLDRENQFGGMWALEQLDLTIPFSTEMYLHLGHEYGNDERNVTSEGLSVYKSRKFTGEYYQGYPVTEPHETFLRNSVVIEFDTYRNYIS